MQLPRIRRRTSSLLDPVAGTEDSPLPQATMGIFFVVDRVAVSENCISIVLEEGNEVLIPFVKHPLRDLVIAGEFDDLMSYELSGVIEGFEPQNIVRISFFRDKKYENHNLVLQTDTGVELVWRIYYQ